MKRSMVQGLLAAALVACGWSVEAALTVTDVQMNGKTGVVRVKVAEAKPARTARPVYLAWGAGDRGADYADWERVRRVGTLAAGATALEFDVPNGVRNARAMRVYLFSGETTGDVWLDAIQSDSDQYINTGVKPNARTACFADFKMNDTGVQQRVFGCDATVCLETYINGGGSWAYTYRDGAGDWQSVSVTATTTDRVQMLVDGLRNTYHLDFNDVNKKVLNVLSGTRTKEATAPVGVLTHLYLSNGVVKRYADSAKPHNGYTYANLYSFWMSKDGELVVNLKPCVKDGVPCAYDSISKTYMKSATANAFKAVDPIGRPIESVAVPLAANATLKGYGESGVLLVGDGTVTYRGAEGAKGSYDGDVKLTSLSQQANVFDITGELTLTKTPVIDCQNGHYPAIVKTGPGTLNIPGKAGETNVWNLGSLPEARAFPALSFDGAGTATNGYTYLTIANGTLALGEGGGRFEINYKAGADLMIGTMTADPKDNAGQQETSGILEIRGGETVFSNWVTVGGKNGFVTTTPDYVPTSGVRVLAGRVDFKGSFTMGRNKNGVPQKDAAGNYIQQRTCPFVEVLGGHCQLWNTSRIGFADDPGADSRILVDKGKFYVCNKDNTTGAEVFIGNCNEGVANAPRLCDITVQNGGTFDVTGLHVINYDNITCNLTVKDGGIYRNNQLWKGATKTTSSLNVLFDGGIAEIRYAGYTGWIKGDLDKLEVGTRGVTLRASSTSSENVLDYICKGMTAKDTHSEEEAQGVTVTYAGTARNAGFVFAAANSYAGPTFVGNGGRLELAGDGTIPAESALTLEMGCSFAPTNQAHTVSSLTYGRACNYNYITKLALVKDRPLTANAFTLLGQPRTDVSLYSAPNVALAEVGTFALIKAPVAAKDDLVQVAALMVCANGAANMKYTFGVTEEEGQAVLSVTVTDGARATPSYQADAGTTNTVTEALTGDGIVTVNAAGRGSSGTVAFGDVSDFTGQLKLMSGTAVLDSLAFAAENPTALYLGQGTLKYTGPDATLAGLYLNFGATKYPACLDSDSAITLKSLSLANGMFFKRGSGDLVFQGNGTFALGNSGVGYDQTKPQGFTADGDGPDNCLAGTSIADGRLIIGTVGDPNDAPTVYGSWGALGVGVRTVARDSGLMETSGEIIMNNGFLDNRGSPLYVGYYHGYKETTPAEGLHPKFTMNGGHVMTADLRLGQAWDGTQTTSPEFIMNGGLFECVNAEGTPGGIYVGYQQATEIAGDTATFTMNGGTVRCGEFVAGNANNTMKTVVNLNGGDLYCRQIKRNGNATSTDKGYGEIHFNGTIVHPGYRRATNTGADFADNANANSMFNHAYVGAGGCIFDFDVWNDEGHDTVGMNFSQKFERDPALAEGEIDGGVTFRNGSTIYMRSGSNGSTIQGAVKFLGGSILGLDANGLVLSNPTFIGAGSGIRLSGQTGIVGDLTLGETGATDLVGLDFCRPGASTMETGLIVTKSLDIQSPITVSHHLGGGAGSVIGSWIGTMDVLLYPASEDANVSLDRFVTNPNLPEVTMTFTKADVTSGTYAGYKKIVVTIAASGTAFGPATATDQAHELTDETLTGLVLTADSADHGFALTGGTIDLAHADFLTAPSIVAESGTHTVSANLMTTKTSRDGNTAYAVGGRAGNILVGAKTGASLEITGTVAAASDREVLINPEGSGGGTTILNGAVTGGTGVRVNSGTLEIPDPAKLNGKKLTIGPATVHVTAPDAMTESSIVTEPGAKTKTSVLRVDNTLVVNGTITASGDGNLIKTGPGELVVNGLTNNQLGGQNDVSNWNLDTAWPANGDSLVQGSSPFCLDEGTVTVGRPGQFTRLGSESDIFLGSQTRGWDYTTDKVTFNMMDGVLDSYVLAVGHGMRRGTDAAKSDLAYVEFNQYGGIVTNRLNLYVGYDLTKYDSHIRATMNLFGGSYNINNYMRLGQTYNKTGDNEPLATLNVYPGAKLSFTYTSNSDQHGNIYVPYAEGIDQLKNSQNRASDGILNLKGGTIENAYLIFVGQNGGRGEVHLDGGVLDCENLVHRTYADTAGTYYYHAFNVADGTACVYFNGGVFCPRSKMDATKDTKKGVQYNATLANFAVAEVQVGGAWFDLSNLSAERYTIAQTLTGAEGDGGLVKLGAKPLALAAPSTYYGDTVVGEGSLVFAANAPVGEILPNSAVRLLAGTELVFEEGSQATLSKLAVDNAEGTVNIVNLNPAANGILSLENMPADWTRGAIPVTVSGTVQKANLKSWTVYEDGEPMGGNLHPMVKNGQLYVLPPQGSAIIVR